MKNNLSQQIEHEKKPSLLAKQTAVIRQEAIDHLRSAHLTAFATAINANPGKASEAIIAVVVSGFLAQKERLARISLESGSRIYPEAEKVERIGGLLLGESELAKREENLYRVGSIVLRLMREEPQSELYRELPDIVVDLAGREKARKAYDRILLRLNPLKESESSETIAIKANKDRDNLKSD